MRVSAVVSVLMPAVALGVTVVAQLPIDAAGKAADVMEGKSITWLALFVAVIANLLCAYMVKVVIDLVRSSTLAQTEVKDRLRSIERKLDVDDNTPPR